MLYVIVYIMLLKKFRKLTLFFQLCIQTPSKMFVIVVVWNRNQFPPWVKHRNWLQIPEWERVCKQGKEQGENA